MQARGPELPRSAIALNFQQNANARVRIAGRAPVPHAAVCGNAFRRSWVIPAAHAGRILSNTAHAWKELFMTRTSRFLVTIVAVVLVAIGFVPFHLGPTRAPFEAFAAGDPVVFCYVFFGCNRIELSVWQKTAKGWQWVTHANLRPLS